jgi:hypothetical protein
MRGSHRTIGSKISLSTQQRHHLFAFFNSLTASADPTSPGTMTVPPIIPGIPTGAPVLVPAAGLHSSSTVSIDRFLLNPDESPNTTEVPIAPVPPFVVLIEPNVLIALIDPSVIAFASGIDPVAMNCFIVSRQS